MRCYIFYKVRYIEFPFVNERTFTVSPLTLICLKELFITIIIKEFDTIKLTGLNPL